MEVIGMRVDAASYASAMHQIVQWAQMGDKRYVCAANVHMLMHAWDSADFRHIVNASDLVVPDGVPLVWVMRLKGMGAQQRVYGPTLMLHILTSAACNGIPVGFYGGRPEVLDTLIERMRIRFKNLNVVYSFAPPFRVLNSEEDALIIDQINRSGVRILFVGLGCPKQEIWMAGHQDRVKAVMLGVGAAFDFHAGIKPQAPAWMQKLGLEWLFRLFTEPRRLWKRYFYHNPRFVFLAVADLLGLLKRVD